ncbi:sensor histidine kinase [Salinimicrobium marinum]|uniref:histidine kinase n=1 Tax=Salinimicrobium marinum TaxID=680283 RepID=A0A918SBW1_9FLAO|nr:GAF domain-containing sensor histidine kinase [Salinimicrobium marinum]GHA33272.1 sensor histidine kinase [Salinimicrobium marinum]
MESINENYSIKEEERINVLHKYEILDTPPDGSFDRITKLAAKLLKVPISIVSLVDTDRIWFKSRFGVDVQEITRDPGLCSSAILTDELYIVEDARNDPRTLTNPLVAGDFGLQFYAGVPLKTQEGFNLGTLCVIDRQPRSLNAEEKEILESLGDLVMNQIELRLKARIAVKHQHQILSTAAHDLKNPLSIMPLLADMIMQNKDNPDAIDDISRQIKEAGKRMAKTINDLLESPKVGTDHVQLRLKAVQLEKLVKGVVDSNSTLARKKGQKLKLTVKQTCIIFADREKLTEVVDNLINNAIKYSPHKKRIEVIVDTYREKAIIEVVDEGPGLTKDDMKNLFRPFISLSPQPTGGENSTGLGLSIVKRLVEAHHGKIYAESDGAGKGTSFIVELPLSNG